MRGERRRIWNGLLFAVLLTVLAFVSVGCVNGSTAPEEEWNRTFGGGYDYPYSFRQTTDGGYILTGDTTRSYWVSGCDVWLMKTDANGNEQWNKTFGGPDDDIAYSVHQTSDGGYILAGWTSYNAGDILLIKTDLNGNEQWNRTFGGPGTEAANALCQAKNGGYILTGSTTSYGAGSSDFWLMKIDSNGNEQWNKTFGGSSGEVARAAQQTADGGYILAGYTNSFGAGLWDIWLIKINSNGNEEWNKTFGGSSADYSWSVQQTSDSGYIIGGHTFSYGAGSKDFWLVKTDPNGNEQWNQTFGGPEMEELNSVQQTLDSGYILCGYTESYGAGYKDCWLVKTDPNGNEQWNQTFGGSNSDVAQFVQQTPDGGYVITSSTYSFGAGNVWLIKLKGESLSLSVHNLNTTKNFASIQAAIDDPETVDGHTILVDAGVYNETVTVNKSLTIIGNDMPTVHSTGEYTINITADKCTIDGFKVMGAGIVFLSNSTIINNNNINTTISGIVGSGTNNVFHNNTISTLMIGIGLLDSSSNTVSNNIINTTHTHDWGVYVAPRFNISSSFNNTIVGNTISSNITGIEILLSNNNTIAENTISASWLGIRLLASPNNSLISNEIFNVIIPEDPYKAGAIVLRESSNNNRIAGNNVNSNNWGINLVEDSSNNTVTGNNIANNVFGIFIGVGNPHGNLIYHNNLINNTLENSIFKDLINDTIENETYNAWDEAGNNSWDNGYLFGGNYWSDYTGSDLYHGSNQDILGSDGIGDIPYANIRGETGAQDRYPFMKESGWLYPHTNIDVGVTSNITLANSSELAAYLPPEYDGMDISDAVVLNVNVTDDTPGNPADDAYTDITINVGAIDIETCKVFKSDLGFLPEVTDVTTQPTVKPPGEPAFSRNVANNTVTVRLHVGDPLLAVLPSAGPLTFRLDLVTGLNLISMPINDVSITTATSLAAKLGPNCTEVVTFNAPQQQLQSYVPGVPLNNFAIAGGAGYFVNLNNPTPVILTGTGWPSPFDVSLVPSLNLIGMPVNDTAVTTASTLAAKIGANCQEVVNWESGTQSYVSYVTGVPLNDFAIRAGDGYFVTVADQTEVTFEGDPWEN